MDDVGFERRRNATMISALSAAFLSKLRCLIYRLLCCSHNEGDAFRTSRTVQRLSHQREALLRCLGRFVIPRVHLVCNASPSCSTLVLVAPCYLISLASLLLYDSD